ncbi:hypothetical protein VB735_16820 [Halotia wernerae UHCC 0503]|nr:hypothetical protein [Halotia wernerae UHCC 0503]
MWSKISGGLYLSLIYSLHPTPSFFTYLSFKRRLKGGLGGHPQQAITPLSLRERARRQARYGILLASVASRRGGADVK